MKFSLLFLGLIFLLPLSSYALGTSSGGGGVGVRCPLSNGNSSLETLDVHEAKLKGVKFGHHPKNKIEAINLASQLMAYHYFSGRFEYIKQYQNFLRKRFFKKIFNGEPILESDDGRWIYQKNVSHLPLSNDYGTYRINPKCHLEQIAYFNDKKDTLFINKKLFTQMDFLNQAVLFTHEIIYFLDRNYPSLHDDFNPNTPRTSKVTRFFVGKLFSSKSPKTKLRSSEQTPHITCENNTSNVDEMTEFRVYPNLNGSFSLLSNDMHGFTSPFRISSKIKFSPEDLLNFGSTISYEGKFKVSDLKTKNKYSYQIEKEPFENAYIGFFKNDVRLGNFDEVICTLNE